MQNFRIYSEDSPAVVDTPLSLSERVGLDGHCIYINKHNFPILAEDNPAEIVSIWIAEKPRTAVLEVTEPEYEVSTRFKVVFG